MTQTYKLQTTPAYMAPEVLNSTEPTVKVDIWAAGVIFYQLVSALKQPFETQSIPEMIRSIKETEYRPLPPTVSPFVQKLMNQLLNKNP